MAILKFEVQADYEKLIKLRNEINSLENQLRNINKTASHDEFERLVNRLSATRQEFKALATEAANAGSAMQKDFSSKIDNATKTLSALEKQMENQKTKISQTEQELAKLGRAYDESVRRQKGGEDEKLEAFVKTQSALEGQRGKLVQLATQHTNTAASVGQMSEAYRQFLTEAGAGTQMATQMMGRLQGLAMSLTGVYGASSFIQNMVQVRGQFQQADTAIESMLGSAEKAKTLMGEVREYAKISPLEFSDVTGATQMMLGFNIEAEKVPKFISAIGDVSMGNGQKFNSLTLAFSQMSAAGKLMGQDLNQMINAGFNPLQQMAKTTGKSISELKEEMSKGAISAEMVQQAFIDVTSEGGKFYKMSEKGSQTINGQMSMLQDSMDAMYNEIGTKAEGFIIDAIGGATDLIGHYQEIGKTIGVVAAAFGTYKAAMIASSAMDNSQEKSVLSAQVKGIEDAINAKQKQMGMKLTDFSVKVEEKDNNSPLREALELREKELATIEQERLTRKAFAEADAAGYDDILVKQRELQALRDEDIREHSDLNEAKLHTEVFNEGDEEYADALKYIEERKQKEDELASAVEEAKARMLKPYQDELDVSQELVDKAQERVDAALESRDAEEFQAASIELKTATERRDTAQTELNTMQQNVNNATKARAAAANEAHALSENADTAATTRNTNAGRVNSLQEVISTARKNAHTLATKIGTTAQIIYGNAVKQVTASLQAMKLALLSNPITAIATVAMTAASAFYMFADSTEDVSTETKRFGEGAAKTIRNVDGLVMTLKGVSSSSKTYKDALDELNQIFSEYGIEQAKESDGLDVINKKREEAIELIKLEGIERERANHIDEGQEEYGKKVDEAKKNFKESLNDVKGEFAENSAAIANILETVVEENAEKLIGKTGKEYQKQMGEIRELARQRLIAAGISEEEVNKQMHVKAAIGKAFSSYMAEVKNAQKGLNDYITLTNNAADAERRAAEGSMTAGQKFAIFKKKVEGADGSVDTIYKNIQKLVQDYNDKEINLKVNLNAEVPAWMKNMKIDQLKDLAVRFSSLADQHKGKKVFMGGRMWTEQQLRQRGLDYAKAAKEAQSNISPEEDKKNKRNAVISARKELSKAKTTEQRDAAKSKLDNAEKAYKNVNDGKTLAQEEKAAEQANKKNTSKASSEASQHARQQAKYNELVARQKEEREQAVKDLAESTRDAEIAAMADGNAKTIAQMKRDAEKKEFELQKEIDAFKKKKIDEAKALWEADPKNQAAIKKGASFDSSTVDTTLSTEEQKYVDEKRKANNAEVAKAELEYRHQQVAAMRDYLKEYGTYQQQKLAIAEEYADKIAKAEAAGETMTARSLEKERDSKVASIDAKSIAMDIDWSQSFQGVGKVLNGIATETLKKVEAFMKTADFKKLGASDKKSYVDLRNQLRQQGADKGSNPFNFGIWKEVEQDMVNYQNAVRNLATATEAEKQAIEEVKAAQQQLAQASTDQEKKIAKDRLQTAQANASVASVNTQGAQDKKDEANDRLVASTNRAQAGIEGFVGAINRMKSGSLYDFYAGIVDLVNCFKDLANASSEVGQAVDGLSAVSNAASGTTEALGATTEALGAATDALSEGAAQALGDVGTKAIGEASQAAGQAIAQAGEAGGQAIQQATDTVANGVSNAGIWGKIIGAILQLLDVFAEDFDGFVTGLVDKIGKAVKGILEDLPRITQELPKIIFDLIKNIFEGIAESMVNSFTFDSVFGFNKEDDLKKSNEKLAEQNKSLESAVSDLKDEMKKGNGGKQSVDAYRDAVEKQKRQIENSRQQWKNSMGKNSTFRSSSNYKLNEDKRWVSAVNNALARYAENNKAKGVQKKTVDSAEALQMLSPEELKAIKDYALDTWDDIKTWGHYYDPDKWEEMVSYAGKLEELTDSFQETLTGTSFDGFRDNFIDALMDMDASSQDFANNFQKQLTEAAMKQTITQELGGRIKSLYSKWADAAESGTQLSDAEVEALMKEQADITEDAMKLREQIFELTGYNGDKSTNASTGSFQGMSQDTGNELNGRFTALQAAGERIDANVAEQTKSLLQMNVTLGELVGKTTESISIADETRDIIANSYIELQEINLNTKQTVVALKTTNDRLQRIENKL